MRYRLAMLAIAGTCASVAAAQSTMTVDIARNAAGSIWGSGSGVFWRGTEGRILVDIGNCPGQWCDGTPRANLYLQLPPGLVYDRAVGTRPSWMTCTGATPNAAGQLVTCTGEGLSGNPNSILQVTQTTVHVAVSPTAPLGAMRLDAAADMVVPGSSTTLAQCQADMTPAWCDRMAATITDAPLPRLEMTSAFHSPPVFAIGSHDGVVNVGFHNAGTAAAGEIGLLVKLPRGFYWRIAATSSLPPNFVCASQGGVDTGLILTCRYTGSFQAAAHGELRLGFDPGLLTTAPGPVELLFAIDDSATPDPALLEGCASDPGQSHCLLYTIGTSYPCALQHGSEGIYCDAFEGPIAWP